MQARQNDSVQQNIIAPSLLFCLTAAYHEIFTPTELIVKSSYTYIVKKDVGMGLRTFKVLLHAIIPVLPAYWHVYILVLAWPFLHLHTIL